MLPWRSKDEEPSTSTVTHWHGQRVRHQPDRYAVVRSIKSGCHTAGDMVPSLLIPICLLLAVTLSPQLDTCGGQ